MNFIILLLPLFTAVLAVLAVTSKNHLAAYGVAAVPVVFLTSTYWYGGYPDWTALTAYLVVLGLVAAGFIVGKDGRTDDLLFLGSLAAALALQPVLKYGWDMLAWLWNGLVWMNNRMVPMWLLVLTAAAVGLIVWFAARRRKSKAVAAS